MPRKAIALLFTWPRQGAQQRQAFEKLVQQLNHVINDQQQQINALVKDNEALAQRISRLENQ